MPRIGDIRIGTEIGYKTNVRYIYAACQECGKTRYVHLVEGRPQARICRDCAIRQRRQKVCW